MTWYWWTHWFWITALSAPIICFPFGEMHTPSPTSLPVYGKMYGKREPLQFPIPYQSDTDDIFDGREIIEASFREEWFNHNVPSLSTTSDLDMLPKIIDTYSSNKPITIIDLSTTNNPIDNDKPSESSSEANATEQTPSTEKQIHPILNVAESSTQTRINRINRPVLDAANVSLPILSAVAHQQNDAVTNASVANSDLTVATGDGPNNTNKLEMSKSGHAKDVVTVSEKGRQSKGLAEYKEELKSVNFSSETKNLLAHLAASSINAAEVTDSGLSSEALTVKRASLLDAGAISGICMAVVGIFCGVSAAGVMAYRRRYSNQPQTLSEPDSSGYIDDTTIRENSDEMYSLDNDSFLNSLEAMTIQNYWTENVKHTKL